MDEVFRTQINGFHGYLQTQHYATRTSKDYEEYVIKFLQWCKDVPNQGGDLEKTMLSYLDQQYHSKSSIAQFKMLRAAVRNYYFYLTGEKLPFSPKQSAPEWIKKEIDGYFAFLRDIADIKETTIIPHCKYVRRFLLYASNQGVCKSSGITVLLPGLLEKLSRIPDPRNPNKIKHKMTVILLYGILMFVYQAPSRRKANQKMTTPLLLENLKAVFPELEDMPHQSTLCRLLEKMDVDSIETAYHELLKQNIRKKRFKNMLHKKRYLVAVDGTQKYVMDECWDERFLRRKIRGKDDEYHYYAYVLEAVLIFANGMVLPLMSEFLENTPELEAIENDEAWKQDCELKAFYRLTKRLKTTFPKLPVTLLLDGLYANGPVMEVCRRNKWHFMIVLKDGSLPSVWQEVNGLLRLDSQGECRHTQKWQDRKQIFNWVNEIEYSYSVGARKKKMLIHVVTCDESWEVTDKTGCTVIRTSRHAWLSSHPISRNNVHELCNLGARKRWLHENSILKEKHQGYHYEHIFSYDWNAMRGYHYLMHVARMLNEMALHSISLIEEVKKIGFQPFIQKFREIMIHRQLDSKRLSRLVESPGQLRLVQDENWKTSRLTA